MEQIFDKRQDPAMYAISNCLIKSREFSCSLRFEAGQSYLRTKCVPCSMNRRLQKIKITHRYNRFSQKLHLVTDKVQINHFDDKPRVIQSHFLKRKCELLIEDRVLRLVRWRSLFNSYIIQVRIQRYLQWEKKH